MCAPIEKILFDDAKVQPTARVIGSDGQALTAAEVHTYNCGPGVRVLSVGRSMQRSSEGPDRDKYKDNSAFQKPETVSLELDRESHVYDVLAGQYLGKTQKAEAVKLDPYVPLIWTLSEDELPALQVRAVQAEPNVTSVDIAAMPPAVLRVARVDVVTPAGTSPSTTAPTSCSRTAAAHCESPSPSTIPRASGPSASRTLRPARPVN